MGFKVEREDGSARFVSPESDLVVTAGSGASGPLKAASRQFLDSVRESYAEVTVNGRQSQRIAGHRAIVTSGQSTNSAGVDIRFLAVVLRGQGQNYTIAAYTALNTDPEQVLPKVNAVVNSFEVTPRD